MESESTVTPTSTTTESTAPKAVSNRCSPLIWGLLVQLFISVGGFSAQQNVTLAWDRNEEIVAGYRLHYGVASRWYTNSVDTGTNIVGTIEGLVSGARYYFAVTAYSADGLESLPSEEVSYLVPGGTLADPVLAETEAVISAAPMQRSPLEVTYEVVYGDPIPVLFPVSTQTDGPQLSIFPIGNPAVAVRIEFEVPPDKLCELQTSRDFGFWESLLQFASQNEAELFQYFDLVGSGSERRFYRLILR